MAFIDARRLNGTSVTADVCIVGAGAAGIAIAREFAGSACRVALVESGGFDFRHRPQFLYLGTNIGIGSFSTGRSRFRLFGGSTTRWGRQCRPLDALDFEARDGVPNSGWPFGREHLEPYYRRAQNVCKLGPYDYAPATWSASDGGALPMDGDVLETKIYQFSFPSDFGQNYRHEFASAANVDVYLNANLIEIATDEHNRNVTRLLAATFNGRRMTFTANIYVLACGGIENARLLLASTSVASNGLGNEHGLVGRYFMDHPYFLMGFYEPATARYDKSYYVIEDYARVGHEQKINAAFALSERVLRRERLNACAIYFHRRPTYKTLPEYFSAPGKSFIHLIDVLRHQEIPDDQFARHLRNVFVGFDKVGRSLARQLAELARPRPRLALRAVLEPTPNPESRVMLGTRKDHFGMPRVLVDWRLNPADKRGLQRLLAVMHGEFTRLGLGRLVVDESSDDSGWPNSLTGGKHHMGTTRMHADPRKGVVDPQCRIHGLSNLYVAGSSVFPTSGYANPTLTIVALAIRLADHIKERLRSNPA
jgi:choline dehydrogenase-like flavoprotein